MFEEALFHELVILQDLAVMSSSIIVTYTSIFKSYCTNMKELQLTNQFFRPGMHCL